jgi:nucleotide-binding universal stress UspA family protein
MYRTILAGFDGSPGAKIALKEAATLGKLLGAKVTAMWVQHALPHYPETVGEIEEEKHAASAFLSQIIRDVAAIEKEIKYPIACKHQIGHPARTLLKVARDWKVRPHCSWSLWTFSALGSCARPYRGSGKRAR